jgi:ribosome recycling factor
LQDKSETQSTLKRFLRRAQNEFKLKVKKIRSDNGSEFKNLQVEKYLEEDWRKASSMSSPLPTLHKKWCSREEEHDTN